jgi:hypothetical protein
MNLIEAKRLLNNPNFLKWFGKSKVIDEVGNPLRVYHGTTKDFDSFKIDEDSTLSRMLGSHFAKDPRVTDAFTIGSYARNDKNWFSKGKPNVITVNDEVINEGGRTIPGYLNINPKKIPQQVYENGAVATDDWAIAEDVAREVFPKRKDLFLKHAKLKWPNSSKEEIDKLYNNILTGADKKFKDFGDYARTNSLDYSPKEIRSETIKEYKKILKEQGYTGLQYINTSSNEVKSGFDPTSYIAFEPSSFKSQFNQGTFDVNDPNMLKSIAIGSGLLGTTALSNEAQAQSRIPTAEEEGLDDAYNPLDMAIAAATGGATLSLKAASAVLDPIIDTVSRQIFGE